MPPPPNNIFTYNSRCIDTGCSRKRETRFPSGGGSGYLTRCRILNLPCNDIKIIVLIRSPVDVVSSAKRSSSSSKFFHRVSQKYETQQLFEYWYITYRNILADITSLESKPVIVFYEDLVQFPVETTEYLFRYIGSNQTKGVSEYSTPDTGIWRWGTDDGGELIVCHRIYEKKW